MKATGQDTLKTRRTLTVQGKNYDYFSLPEAAKSLGDISRLPVSLKVLLENVLRFEDGTSYTVDDAKSIAGWLAAAHSDKEVPFKPARILLQDFTGVPAVVDLAAMRDGITRLGGDPRKVNPLVPVDLVIDHSVQIDVFAQPDALAKNVDIEFERNGERYRFLRWGQDAFDNFRVVPPGTGICHQVNLEYLGQCVWTGEDDGKTIAYPDTLYGADSHTTMVNGLGILGWGVGGIEAEAAMLGQPIAMLIPDVIGFRMTGKLPEGATATDLVLTVTQMLRRKGVVGKFVEFFGPGLDELGLADRATVGNMSPEYGATCGFFPVDKVALDYLHMTGRDEHRIALVEAYLKAQGMFREPGSPEPVFTDTLELDLGTVVPSLAGPKRPQDRVALKDASTAFKAELTKGLGVPANDVDTKVKVEGKNYEITHGDVVIAAITSCTNTSNPSVLVAAGLVARKAHAKGLRPKPWVKTSLAPGSQVVTEYLEKSGLQADLDAIGFNLVGYGCTTCIGNSGPLEDAIVDAIEDNRLVGVAVLSGNRNFEGRVHANVRANYLASPPLVVAYSLLGKMTEDITTAPLGTGNDGKPVYLRDVWPIQQGDRRHHRGLPVARSVPQALRRGDQRPEAVADDRDRYRQRDLSLVRRLDLREEPALLRGHHHGPAARRRHQGRAHPGGAGRFDHHRPHQPRRFDPQGIARRRLPAGTPGDAGELQQLRRTARQPRSDDARHVRQHPHPQRDADERRRRHDQAPAVRRSDADLRRGDALQGGGRAAGGVRRQGIRHRLARATGRRRAHCCSASRRSSSRASSASTARTWSAWACCR